jgi:hypothetical protein
MKKRKLHAHRSVRRNISSGVLIHLLGFLGIAVLRTARMDDGSGLHISGFDGSLKTFFLTFVRSERI